MTVEECVVHAAWKHPSTFALAASLDRRLAPPAYNRLQRRESCWIDRDLASLDSLGL